MRRAIAIDFDGCICQSKYPEIGEPNWHVIEEAKKEQEAGAGLIAANAEAEKSKVAADAELYVAEKKAEANRALNDSLNSNLLEYYKITDVESRWNGELPAYVGDGNSIPIINGIN